MLAAISVSVPVFAFLLLWLLLAQRIDWRSSLLLTAVLWGTILTFITESLSLVSGINFHGILAAWFAVSCLLGVLFWKRQKVKAFPLLPSLKTLQPFMLFSGAGIGVVASLLGLLALVVPTNNWDSLSYHMSRVVNWMQNQNVTHYPVADLRQLYLSPWSEFAIMHLQILSGSDWLANFIQWGSMVGSAVGVSLIAKQLGASPVGQVLASVISVTIPMGILQASTTQNDYAAAFWLVCFAHFVLQIWLGHFQLRQFVGLGGSLGLALLTKATGYIYALPFCVLLAVGLVLNYRKVRWLYVAVLASLSLGLNIGFWWRNFALFSNPIGISDGANRLYTVPALLSNLSRNMAIHAVSGYQPLNDKIEQLVINFHRLLQLDVRDSRTTFQDSIFQLPVTAKNQPIFLHEDTAGNPIHLILILICLGLYFCNRRVRTPLRTYYLMTLLGAVCCYNLLIAWQPWGSRLHLPFFVLAAAFMGTVLADSFTGYLVPYIAAAILLGFSVPYLLFNSSKPLAQNSQFISLAPHTVFQSSRVEQYFNNGPILKDAYFQAVDLVKSKQCSQVGLAMGNAWEYPLWVLFGQHRGDEFQHRDIRFRNVSVPAMFTTKQTKHPSRQFIPCAIISNSTFSKHNLKLLIQRRKTIEQTRYTQIWSGQGLYVYEPKQKKKM